MNQCQVEGCKQKVSKEGYEFCLAHWKADRAGKLARCASCQRWHESAGPATASSTCVTCKSAPGDVETASAGEFLSATKIGEHLGLSAAKVNLILVELGWIERYVKGWVPTDRGNALGANVRELRGGIPYAVWPASILKNAALLSSVKEQAGEAPAAPREPSDFRTRFPANFRTQDGHMVRSRAEVLIDNWLYMQGLVHAYERRLPIEEECYCDFYLPAGKGVGGRGVYIEFWGRESDPKYRSRMVEKQAIYAKHELRLIELGDAEIERLDDVLPRILLRFGIESV